MAEGMEVKRERRSKRILLIINAIILVIGSLGAPIIMRFYFNNGGQRIWLSTFLVSAGFPVILIPLTITHYISPKPKMFSTTPFLFMAFASLGIFSGLCNYLYTLGMSRLPVSTSTLVMATNLAFTAVVAFLLVKQKFTFYSLNAVALLTFGAGILADRGGSDRPAGESTKQYVIGFIMTLGAAAMTGLLFPVVELIYKRTSSITYSLVLEVQMVLGFSSTLFCIVGMILDNDFKVIPREAQQFGLGEARYYAVLVGSAVLWQFYTMGGIGLVFCASSLFSGVMISALLPITEILAVIVFKENFQVEKGVSLVLSLWGFVSYFYGEFKQAKKMKNYASETELSVDQRIPTP